MTLEPGTDAAVPVDGVMTQTELGRVGRSPLLEAVLFPFVEEIGFAAAQIHDLWTAVALPRENGIIASNYRWDCLHTSRRVRLSNHGCQGKECWVAAQRLKV